MPASHSKITRALAGPKDDSLGKVQSLVFKVAASQHGNDSPEAHTQELPRKGVYSSQRS